MPPPHRAIKPDVCSFSAVRELAAAVLHIRNAAYAAAIPKC